MMASIKVKKRDGSFEDFDVDKIKTCIEFACEGLEVNPLALESLFNQNITDGITTKMLQANLIHHATTLCSAVEPDWTIVAGRLETMNLWADTRSYDTDFKDFVADQKRLGIWTHAGFDKYTEEEIEELGEYMVKERDLNHSYASIVTAKQKYLLEGECIQHMFMGEAMIIASVEEEESRISFCKEVYDAVSNRELSLATPWLSNLRNAGNISSCFIVSVQDTLKSIYGNLTNAAMISQSGGGLGVDLSQCRAMGSSLMGQEGKSGGILGWVKLFNDTAVFVNQGGKRAGAFTIHCPVWHSDIENFLACQTEHGDPRSKSYDIKPQVGIHDIFMRMKDQGESVWHTFCPHEVEKKLGIKLWEVFGDEFDSAYHLCVKAKEDGVLKVGGSYSAKKLFIEIMKVQLETGMPYLTFLDALNRGNPNKHEGTIPCFNLCTESTSVVVADKYAHTCNLLSVVVGRVPMDKLEYFGGLACHILDNGIALTNPPVEISRAHNERFRTIGIGIQGLHDIVAREHKSFGDYDFLTEVAERIQYGAVKESVILAKKRGAYPAFHGSEWYNGNILAQYQVDTVVGYDWAGLQEEINLYGIRNSQLTSPAPNTSSSIFMDAAAGIMPVYSAFFYEDNANGMLPVAAMYLKEYPLSYSKNVTKYNPWDLPKAVGALQKFVDTGISAEYVMDKNRDDFKAKHLWDTLDNAWKFGNKAVYYVRTIKRGETLVKDDGGCVGCAG